MKVKSVTFNWCQVGSTCNREGAGENWEKSTVGVEGVTHIVETMPDGNGQRWNYAVYCGEELTTRIFNPSYVEYIAELK